MNYIKNEERCSTIFFSFSVDETKDELAGRLQKVKKIGLNHIIASFKTQGMQQARFDQAYFAALDRLVEACREQEVQFWLEDYAPFPTGSANGAYEEAEYAELNKLFIDERHIDLTGPVPGAVIRIDNLQNVVYGKQLHRFAKVDLNGRKRICIIAYRMKENTENAAAPLLEDGTAVLLDQFVSKGFLKWDIPSGRWRIFVLYSTYESAGRANFMNLLSRASVGLEIEKVHQPLYEHLKAELGHTWIGFFYDEPELGNAGGDDVFDYFLLPGRRSNEATDCNVLPWSPEMPGEMAERDPGWLCKLPSLFYDAIKLHKDFRCQYMDAVTSLVRENYNGQVYHFCHQRGIGYIGHILEDENCHTRLGCGAGHYFRQQYFQDEAGIDVIAGQILPGRDHSASWYGVGNADGEFYHYGLAKLASSEAHINPLKKNRTAAECFAMYGQQGFAERKFLLDHLMVNGINRMLLADMPSYEASDEYAKEIVGYTDRICRLLRSSKPVIKTAVLYHAEAEWRDGEKAMKFQKPGAVLARNQISYDVVPADIFTFPERYHTVTESGLMINGNRYEALIIPTCSYLPKAVAAFIRHCRNIGFPVFFVNEFPAELRRIGEENSVIRCVPLEELAEAVKREIETDISVKSPEKDWIRYSHVECSGAHYHLLHNEAPYKDTQCEIVINGDNEAVVWDPMTDLKIIPKQQVLSDGYIRIWLHLGRYEMKILCISDSAAKKGALRLTQKIPHNADWQVELPDGRIVGADVQDNRALPCLETYLGYDFYGMLIYRTSFHTEGELAKLLNLGRVSDCCEVFLNGQSIGKRAAAPYLFYVQDIIREGENELMIQVYNSGGNIKNPTKIFGVTMDSLTTVPYELVEPMGISGPVQWIF